MFCSGLACLPTIIINRWVPGLRSWPLIEFNWSKSPQQICCNAGVECDVCDCVVLVSPLVSPESGCASADILITENPPKLRRVSLKVLSRADRRGNSEVKERMENKRGRSLRPLSVLGLDSWTSKQIYFHLFMFAPTILYLYLILPIYLGTISHIIHYNT